MPKLFSTIKPTILQCAIELFGERGYDAVTTRDLAAAAEVDATSIYRLYETKENLYRVAIADVVKRAESGMGQILLLNERRGRTDPRKKVGESVRMWYDSLLRADARILQQVLKRPHPFDENVLDEALVPVSEIIATVSRLLKAELKAKDADTASLSTEMLIWSLFELKILQKEGQPSTEETTRVSAIIENWLNLVLPKK